MNKKRLYKQNGRLHPRGIKVAREAIRIMDAFFLRHEKYHPRDLALILTNEAITRSDLVVTMNHVAKQLTPKV